MRVRVLFVLCLALSLVTCSRRHQISCPEVDISVNRYGDKKPSPILKKKTVVNFFTPAGLISSLEDTPMGKIDKIIKENPDWQFLFYISCNPGQKGQVMKVLDKYNCNFSVLLDYKDAFRKENKRIEKDLTAIGFILGADNNVIALSVIGDTRSMFDASFKRAKRIAR